ncbi:biotin carboxyl carrier protein of acetyl-coa carboxylase 1 chloroplastic [Phtheirospermum japonicum]|uniref:Biotin carboxyl carrier protein of acetyl-coa carboxylase 1 chloroplastic n=1 Tax=Phtheirospermum japonicum TaxID=374723 RepID=A0A830CW35_9LAMI|nr:biotin carboxyl carrier protein of acetyl-coa carboxylase 1 chloroplastic [Phtheirospermum japonicum]
MATSSFGAATASAAAASLTENAHKSSTYLPLCHRHSSLRPNPNKVSFRLSARPKLRFSSKAAVGGSTKAAASTPAETKDVKLPNEPPLSALATEESISEFINQVASLVNDRIAAGGLPDGERPTNPPLIYRSAIAIPPFAQIPTSPSALKAQSNEAAVGGSTKAAASTPAETKDVKLPNEPPLSALATEESISEFINQVASLVKPLFVIETIEQDEAKRLTRVGGLVDSKDIVELELKQLDCELLIRKKEALTPPPSAPITYVQSQPQPAALPPVSTPSPVPTAAPSPAPTPAPSPTKAQPPKSSHPPLKCPMAGTFYRSPGPGEPPFVKVGDKVKKGQVLCIIEAMKLMNEIEYISECLEHVKVGQ